MIVEHLEQALRDEAGEMAKQPHRWNRGSALGYCPRRLGYQKLGVVGDPITPRRMSILGDGTAYDLVLKDRIQRVLDDRVIDGDFLGDHEVMLEGVPISYHIDMGMQLADGRLAVVEIKTAADMTFDRAVRGQIDESYLAQAWFYHYATGFPVTIFIFYRKQTSHVCEVIFDSEATETIITKRYGGNELEIAANDPLLIAEVRSPFDVKIESRVRETVRSVRDCSSLTDLPIGVRVVEKETVSAQGKAKAEEARKLYGEPSKVNGQWSYFETGREILGFPCSYCAFHNNCFPGVRLELDNGKVKWIVPSDLGRV